MPRKDDRSRQSERERPDARAVKGRRRAPKSGYAVRPMEWDDLPRLAAMDRGQPNAWDYDDLARSMHSGHVFGVVAWAGAKAAEGAESAEPVGWLAYFVSDVTRRGCRPHLRSTLIRLAVAPEWRRRGVGTFLLGVVEGGLVRHFSRRWNAGKLTVCALVPERWLGPQLFLRSAGFVVPGPRRGKDGRKDEGGIIRSPFTFCDDDGYRFERRREWGAGNARRARG